MTRLKKNNYRIASLTLGMVSAGFFITYPFHATFFGGLLASGFSAAMIGGLADWFAVTALFRRPLGIRPGRIIRTEIIPRNRERIFSSLTDMVQNEILSQETLKRRLDDYDVAGLLLGYVTEHGGYRDLRELVCGLVDDTLDKLDPQAVGELANSLIRENAVKLAATPLAAEIIDHAVKMGYVEKLSSFTLDRLAELARVPQTGRIIYELVRQAIKVYEKGMDRRKFANSLIGLSPVQLAEEIQAWIAGYLDDIKASPTHHARQGIREWIGKMARELRSNPDWQRRLEFWTRRLVGEKLDITGSVAAFFRKLGEESKAQLGTRIIWLLENRFEVLVSELVNNTEKRRQLDKVMKNFFIRLIDARHGEIGKLVQASLQRLDDENLVHLIAAKAGEDLQIIRINGSVVGGMAGLVLYLLTYWLR